MYKFKKKLFSVKRFSNYSDRSFNLLNLDRNEKVIPLSKNNKKRFLQYLSKDNYELYPNLKGIYKKLSKFLKIDSSNVLLTEGVSGAIKVEPHAVNETKMDAAAVIRAIREIRARRIVCFMAISKK